ncbi:uncharacterized protein [Malus domestica]|uniref:uncharacterized protein n=1 Tax=Malus domestica TaxID=3750 RepID=UPI003976E445
MTAQESLLINIDKEFTGKVKMCNGQLVSATGRGTLVIDTKQGRRYIKEVMLVPGLDENLWSVGQMIIHGYFLLFRDSMVEIFDDRSLHNMVIRVEMTENKSFPLPLNYNQAISLRASVIESTWLWYKRYGHLNFQSLKDVQRMDMVQGLPKLHGEKEICEGCVLGKHHWESFEAGKSWRATQPLETIYIDVCGPMQTATETSNKCIFVSYGNCEKGYRLFNLKTQKINILKDVVFNEDTRWNREDGVKVNISVPMIIGGTDNSESSQNPQNAISQNSTPSSTPVKLKSLSEIYVACNFCIVEPENFEEAESDIAWKKAMEDEMAMIEKNSTWELVNRPSEKPMIGFKWVYKTKLNMDGTVQKNKARLVAKGYFQQPGVDFNETLAPVARLDTIRTLISLAAQKGWNLFQLDVKSAFLNGVLEEEVYVDQSQGFEVKNEENKVYRLIKALYGLKQALKAWYSEIDTYFSQRGFKKSPSEATVYVKGGNETDVLMVGIYVDDVVFTGNNEKMMMDFKEDKMQKYEMSDLGKIVGSLLYLTATRPDVMFAASLLSRFMCNPTKIHMGTAKRGVLSLFGSVKQQSVALSIVEAEYVSAAEATSQAIWEDFEIHDAIILGSAMEVGADLKMSKHSLEVDEELLIEEEEEDIHTTRVEQPLPQPPKPSKPPITSKDVPISFHSNVIPPNALFPHRFLIPKKDESEKDILEAIPKVQSDIPILGTPSQVPDCVEVFKEPCTPRRRSQEKEVAGECVNCIKEVVHETTKPKEVEFYDTGQGPTITFNLAKFNIPATFKDVVFAPTLEFKPLPDHFKYHLSFKDSMCEHFEKHVVKNVPLYAVGLVQA